MFSRGNLDALECPKMFYERFLGLQVHRSEDEIALPGLQKCERASRSKTAFVARLLGHHDLALLRHVNHSHLVGNYHSPASWQDGTIGMETARHRVRGATVETGRLGLGVRLNSSVATRRGIFWEFGFRGFKPVQTHGYRHEVAPRQRESASISG